MRRMKHKRERRAAKQDPENHVPTYGINGMGNVSCTFLLGARVRFVSYRLLLLQLEDLRLRADLLRMSEAR